VARRGSCSLGACGTAHRPASAASQRLRPQPQETKSSPSKPRSACRSSNSGARPDDDPSAFFAPLTAGWMWWVTDRAAKEVDVVQYCRLLLPRQPPRDCLGGDAGPPDRAEAREDDAPPLIGGERSRFARVIDIGAARKPQRPVRPLASTARRSISPAQRGKCRSASRRRSTSSMNSSPVTYPFHARRSRARPSPSLKAGRADERPIPACEADAAAAELRRARLRLVDQAGRTLVNWFSNCWTSCVDGADAILRSGPAASAARSGGRRPYMVRLSDVLRLPVGHART
jgi:hypothetical protein